jgi:hypothetical protein
MKKKKKKKRDLVEEIYYFIDVHYFSENIVQEDLNSTSKECAHCISIFFQD